MSDSLLQLHQTPIIRENLTNTFLIAFEVFSRFSKKEVFQLGQQYVGARRGICAMGQTRGTLQDTAARARPSGLACRLVLRSSGKIMQIRTKTSGSEHVPREPSGNHKWCVQLGSNGEQSCSDTDDGHVTYNEFSQRSFRKPSRAHRRVQHYVHNPCPFFVLLGNIGLHLSARESLRSAMCRIYDHSYMRAAFITFSAVRL